MILQRLQLLTTLVMSSLAAAAGTQPQGEGAPTGPLSDVFFTEYSPLSGAAEVTRRLMSPLNALRVRRALQHSGNAVRDQSIDLTHEKFAVYVSTRRLQGAIRCSCSRHLGGKRRCRGSGCRRWSARAQSS
jgi:hypothetical protein